MKSPVKIVTSENFNKDQEIFIAPEVIQNLQLNIKNTRNNRRKIAREKKVPWDLYRKLEMLVTMRIRKGFNPSTGKEINI